MRKSFHALLSYLLPALSGCTGVQSALDPGGDGAKRIAELFWGMTLGGAIIYLSFVALTLYAVYFRSEPHSKVFADRLIIGCSVIFPTVVLAGLLVYGLVTLPSFLAPAPAGSLRVRVFGHQWWWRIRYEPAGRQPFETANEIRLPVDEHVQFELESPSGDGTVVRATLPLR